MGFAGAQGVCRGSSPARNSIAAISIGARDSDAYKNLLPNCHQVAWPLDAKALARVEARLKKRDVAAFIMEPIICNLAAYVPDEEFVRGVRALCSRYGTLFEDAAYASRVGEACRERGLLVSVEEEVIMIFPTLTTAWDTAERALAIIEEAA